MAWGEEDNPNSPLARERRAHEATKAKLRDAAVHIAHLETSLQIAAIGDRKDTGEARVMNRFRSVLLLLVVGASVGMAVGYEVGYQHAVSGCLDAVARQELSE